MHIERLQVEEGFLDGLDIDLSSGLNVIIGARGSGKTSLIELIRFCLDANGAMSDSRKKSREHALSILGTGQISITLSHEEKKIHVTRTATDSSPRFSDVFHKPIIFSQTEIETIGLEASGRLRLIDSFIPEYTNDSQKEQNIINQISSLTNEISKVSKELEELTNTLESENDIDKELEIINHQEFSVSKGSERLQEKANLLQELSEKLSKLTFDGEGLKRLQAETYIWYEKIKSACEQPIGTQNDETFKLHKYQTEIGHVKTSLEVAYNSVVSLWNSLDVEIKTNENEKLNIESLARDLRSEIEALQEGAGQVMRRGQELRAQKARYESIKQQYFFTSNILNNLKLKRSQQFDALELIRHERFKRRERVINELNDSLSPTIILTIQRNGQQNQFASLIADLLRGSNLRYNELAPILASTMSPRMLLEAVENFELDLVSSITRLSNERAARILNHLKNIDLGLLSTLDVDDEICMRLLDGNNYKDISMLSTGQRCTVILPIVLAHKKRIVIVDQPEDHIDNAFIANTLIKAIVRREPNGQLIFSTHNPNIPVLGDAECVIHLASDGRKGFVVAKGSLDDQKVVNSISTVMEGGAEAFAKRSYFYNQYPL